MSYTTADDIALVVKRLVSAASLSNTDNQNDLNLNICIDFSEEQLLIRVINNDLTVTPGKLPHTGQRTVGEMFFTTLRQECEWDEEQRCWSTVEPEIAGLILGLLQEFPTVTVGLQERRPLEIHSET